MMKSTVGRDLFLELVLAFDGYTHSRYLMSRTSIHQRAEVRSCASRYELAHATTAATTAWSISNAAAAAAAAASRQVLNNVDALAAELAYLIRQSDAGVEEADEDLFLYLKRARDNFDKYLANIPDEDLQKARNYVKGATKRK